MRKDRRAAGRGKQSEREKEKICIRASAHIERGSERERERERGIGHCFGPLFPKQTASTLFRQEILCSARQAGRTGNGLLSVLLFVINTRCRRRRHNSAHPYCAMHVKVIVAITRLRFFLPITNFPRPFQLDGIFNYKIMKIFITYFPWRKMRLHFYFRASSISRKADNHARSVHLKRIARRKSARGNPPGASTIFFLTRRLV